jgi:hypothetical protein
MCTHGGAYFKEAGQHYKLFPEDFAAEKPNFNSAS